MKNILVSERSGSCTHAVSEQELSRSHDASSCHDHEEINPLIVTQMTLAPRERCCWLTVEPSIFLGMLGHALSSSVITQLLLARNCQEMFPLNATKCDMLVYRIDTQEARQLEALLEPRVTVLQMYKTVIEAFIPAVLSMFLGPWSDHYGRKPLMLWPVFGYGLTYIIYTFLSVVPDLCPFYFLLASIPVALSGGLITVISGMYAYTSDITSAEKRALRMGFLDVCLFGGVAVGGYLSAPLFSVAGKYGYLTVFATSATCYLLSFLYVTFIPESVNVSQMGSSNGGLCSVFDIRLVSKMIATCCKRREHYRRAIIFLVIIVISTCIISLEGTLIGMYIFSVWLRISDSVFALCVFLTKCAQTLIFGFAPKDWYLYIGSAVGVLGGVSGPLCRSLISKTVPLEDIGTVFAMTSMIESLTPIAASPLYTFVYNATLLTFPGTFYIVSCAIFGLDVILLSWVIVLQHLSPAHSYTRIQQVE
ncbi:proton-coupled folate transporter isoform X2 [Cryptotermes secundus]|uniref:proton-coupled folate transporter isoform X2 n=1 Tax=Cryptotermes secundus TaxID=105785 RepID=UPI000CD7AAB2|nr:proton-coupled folate transporter isoform X2 [Cryptotermes secundus]